MADGGAGLSQLTETQRDALQQFASFTNQSPEQGLQILQKCQWNVEIAISRFFDGEPATDALAEAQAEAAAAAASQAAPAPRAIGQRETLLSSSAFSDPRRVHLEPAPRIVPQPAGKVNQRASLLVSILLAPLGVAYTLLSRTFGILGYMFPFLPRLVGSIGFASPSSGGRAAGGRRPLNPRDNAARFAREFEEEYGSHQLSFSETGYATAFDAAKRDLKFLLVVLLSPEHDDTSSFVRDTLLSEPVTNFFAENRSNLVLWGGNVHDAEAYQVADSLRATKFPFTGVVVHTPSPSSPSSTTATMSTVARIAGPHTPAQFIAKLRIAIQQNTEALTRTRNMRAEQTASRNLREQQNSAYERSLAADRERARQKREEQERRSREEKVAREVQEKAERHARDLRQWQSWRAASIPSEPQQGKDTVAFSIRMVDGRRVVRRFAADADVEELYAFVECEEMLRGGEVVQGAEEPEGFAHEYKFRLVSPFPRTVFEVADGGTVLERIGKGGNLIMESTDGDDVEDE